MNRKELDKRLVAANTNNEFAKCSYTITQRELKLVQDAIDADDLATKLKSEGKPTIGATYYVRDILAQKFSVKMNGQNSYRFRSLRYGRGRTINEAIDNEIAFLKEGRTNET